MGKARLLSRLRKQAGVKKAPALPPAELSLTVIGATRENSRRTTGDQQMEILLCQPGERVTLELSLAKEQDQGAITVFSSRGVQIGYLVADRARIIRRAWSDARDVRAVFQQRTVSGAAIRVAFDRDPELPAPRPPLPRSAEESSDKI